MKSITVLVIGAAVLWPATAAAQSDKPGIDFQQECEGTSDAKPTIALVKQFGCLSYLQGFLDAYQVTTATILGAKREVICLPDRGLSTEQALLVVTKWMRENLSVLRESARGLIFLSLLKAFPCSAG